MTTIFKTIRLILERQLDNKSVCLCRQKSAREAVAMRVAMLQADLDWRTNRLRHENDRYEGLQTHNIRRGISPRFMSQCSSLT